VSENYPDILNINQLFKNIISVILRDKSFYIGTFSKSFTSL